MSEKQSPNWEDLSAADLELLDKHINAMEKGEYGVVIWPDNLNHRTRAIRQHLLDENPHLIDDLKDASRNKKASFLPNVENPHLPLIGQGKWTEKLLVDRLHEITEDKQGPSIG